MISFKLLLFLVASASCDQVIIQLSGRNIACGDLIWGKPDPYVNVKYAVANNPWTNIGSTEVLTTENPNWSKTFEFAYVELLDQHLQFDVKESDAMFDDNCGTVTIRMADIVTANSLERNFGKGTLIIRNIAKKSDSKS